MARIQSPERATTGETEEHKVYLWRLRCLEEAGIDTDAAKRIADTEFDLHVCLGMISSGCPTETLLRIVL